MGFPQSMSHDVAQIFSLFLDNDIALLGNGRGSNFVLFGPSIWAKETKPSAFDRTEKIVFSCLETF